MSTSVQPRLKVIKKRNEIKEILQKGRRVKTNYGNFYLMRGDQNIKRMAVLIKKQVGNAVQRNYCKRIVREYIRRSTGVFGSYHDIIFLYNFQGAVSYREIYADFSDCLILK